MCAKSTVFVVLMVFALAGLVVAGNPDSPAPPDSTFLPNLEDLYLRLATGAIGTPSAFTEPTTAPGAGTMYTIEEIMAAAPVPDNSAGARPSDVLIGRTFWGLRTDGTWGLQTGTLDPTLDSDGDGVPDYIDRCPGSVLVGDLCWGDPNWPDPAPICLRITEREDPDGDGCMESRGATGASGCDASTPSCLNW